MTVRKLNPDAHLAVGHDRRCGGRCEVYLADAESEAVRIEQRLRKSLPRTRRGKVRDLLGP